MKVRTRTLELSGSGYEIGTTLGHMAASGQMCKSAYSAGPERLYESELKKAAALFDRWCPGLNDELRGFAEALKEQPEQLAFYGMTYLRPNCSQLALLPDMTKSGKPLVARSYEFSHEAEDFTLVRTCADGKYRHLGTSVLLFGRDEGVNECGLAVTMSSCGFPVGAPASMRRPSLVGLQFWAVIRTLLENCRDTDEALALLAEMPIAYNLNLMLTDKGGNIALFETLDGRKALKRISPGCSERYLFAANHPVLPELIPYEPAAMRHSLRRHEWLHQRLNDAVKVSEEDLKDMLLSKYPNGLCCHFFREYLGTTKSIIIDPACGTIEVCWGGLGENGWRRYSVYEPLAPSEYDINISVDSMEPDIMEYVPLHE